MRKSIALFSVFICTILVITGFGRAHAEKVLVNIWDGTEWEKIEELFRAGNLPNAKSVGRLFHLTSNKDCFPGEYECGDGCMTTSTKPQHAIMLTGVLADEHGVFTNTCYQLIPDGTTVYEEIEFLDRKIRTAHISSKPKHFGERTFGNIIEAVDYFVAKSMFPKAAVNKAIKLIRRWRKKDFFIVCHFRKPDGVGHYYGVHSREYKRAILHCDKQLGRILNQLASYGILGETKIYILSDHGFGTPDPDGHGDAPNTFIISNDETMTDDIYMMREVAGFLLSNFGL